MPATPTVRTVTLDKLTPDPANVRKSFDKQGITTLAANLKAVGVLQPLVVREEKKRLIIVDGERRYRAAKVAKLKAVPVIVQEHGDAVQRSFSQVAMNSLREPLKPLELGRLLVSLRKEHKLSDNEIAAHLDKQGIPALSKGQMAELMRLVDLPTWAQDMVDASELPAEHVGPLLAAGKEPKVLAAAQKKLREAVRFGGRAREVDVADAVADAYRSDKDTRDLEKTYGYGKADEALVVHFNSKKACAGCEHLRIPGWRRYCRNPKHFDELNAKAKEAGLLPGGKKPEKPRGPGPKETAVIEKQKAERKEQNQGRRLAEYLDGRHHFRHLDGERRPDGEAPHVPPARPCHRRDPQRRQQRHPLLRGEPGQPVTPDEAKTKWCPFFRSKGPVDQWSDNRDHGGAGFCIGPSCMAWRFGMELRRGFRVADPATAHDEPQRPAGIPASWVWEPAVSDEGEPAGWVEPMAEALARQEGYCGLAGKDGAP